MLDFLEFLFGIMNHGTELVEIKPAAIKTCPFLYKKHGSLGRKLNDQGDDREYGDDRQQPDENKRSSNIKNAFNEQRTLLLGSG